MTRAPGANGLQDRLTRNFPGFTKAEKEIANYMLMNLDRLAFETAASIAETVGVSQMTVGRFLRTVGYQRLSELKQDLRDEMETAPVLVSNRLDRIKASRETSGLWDNFELEVSGLQSAYELRGTPAWTAAVTAISEASQVHVAGFQTIRGIASSFAGRLAYLRDGVHQQDGRDGTFAEVFAGSQERRCIVLFEMRRYTQLSHSLLAAAQEEGVSIVLICDSHCYWARDYTDTVLPLRTDSNLFWDSQAPFSCLTGLLLDDIILNLGYAVSERLDRMRRLQDRFGAFQD
jgi:DNA-binding MurR/RpiR family transcriptional regulator